MTEPVICPAGQYVMGLTECVDCTPGSFCAQQGLEEPTGLCPEGFYCPEGTADPVVCPEGFTTDYEGAVTVSECVELFHCPEGMIIMGDEQDCVMCPAGFFCADLSDDPEWCPMGFYCPAGTMTPIECPEGTTNIAAGSADATSCVPVDEVSGEAIVEDDGTADEDAEAEDGEEEEEGDDSDDDSSDDSDDDSDDDEVVEEAK